MFFEDIIKKSQQDLKKALVTELNNMGYPVYARKGFVYAKGSLPVMLVAHLDTVHKQPVKIICYSQDNVIMMSPEGIGGDDRAGVYMILQIIKKHRCHVLFCEDEETGGIGATAFVKSGITPEINYIVELDRRGSNDAVFYDCDNPDFTNFVCDFGFKEEFGTFSDISIIAPKLGIAAVNISTGYYNEHTRHEHINLIDINRNIELVGQMVTVKTEKFEYIECKFSYYNWYNSKYYQDMFLNNKNHTNRKRLMFFPESAFVRVAGEITQDGVFLIDKQNKVYKYFDNIDAAVIVTDAEALTEHGTPLKYDKKTAIEVEIINSFEVVNE